MKTEFLKYTLKDSQCASEMLEKSYRNNLFGEADKNEIALGEDF